MITITGAKAKRTRISRTPDQWQAVFEQFEHSGQTREQFCHEHDISVSSFSRWRTKIRKRTSSKPLPTDPPLFAELTSEMRSPVSPGWDIELQLGTDIFLRLRRPC
jgi:transposase-like protein